MFGLLVVQCGSPRWFSSACTVELQLCAGVQMKTNLLSLVVRALFRCALSKRITIGGSLSTSSVRFVLPLHQSIGTQIMYFWPQAVPTFMLVSSVPTLRASIQNRLPACGANVCHLARCVGSSRHHPAAGFTALLLVLVVMRLLMWDMMRLLQLCTLQRRSHRHRPCMSSASQVFRI